MILFSIFIFLFGLAIGSFLNVLIFRLGGQEQSEDRPPSERRSVLRKIGGRSYCPKCGHKLSWLDLVPVLSFLFLRGRCRYCGEKISWQYPIVEIATGILFLIIFNFQFSIFNQLFNFQLSNYITLGYFLFIISCLVVIFVSDLRYFIIPDEIIIAGIIGFFVYRLFGILDLFGNWKLEIGNWQTIGYHLLTAIAAGTFFLTIVLITKGKGMGLGDVKLAFLMGLILGWPNILAALLLAFISGALVGLGLMIAGRAKLKSELPFGTFLCAATFFVMILGEGILEQGISFFS